jgi:hypothetical protein
MVTYRHRRHFGKTLAGITAAVYFGLVCLVAACAPALPTVSSFGEHAHHQHEAAHSSLCAWACQALSQSGPAPSASGEVSSLVVLASVVPHVKLLSVSHSVSLHPRAPPVSTLG